MNEYGNKKAFVLYLHGSPPVDGVLGTDFLEKHKAIIDYSRSALYLKTNPDEKD